MNNKGFARMVPEFRYIGWGLLIAFCVFSPALSFSSQGYITSSLRKLMSLFYDTEMQWCVYLGFGIYFLGLLCLCHFYQNGRFHSKTAKNQLWVSILLIIGSISYAHNYELASVSNYALVLLVGATIGQLAARTHYFHMQDGLGLAPEMLPKRLGLPSSRGQVVHRLLIVLVLMLAIAAFFDSGLKQYYQNQVRWSGPWINPNTAGLLMALGFSVALGLGFYSWHFAWNGSGKHWASMSLFFGVALLSAYRLIGSYSRGAWVAASVGAIYLLWDWISRFAAKPFDGSSAAAIPLFALLKLSKAPLLCLLLSISLLCFWEFRGTDCSVARRAFSMANQNDFSWRNRIVAYKGALQIMADRPWLGCGWNGVKHNYEQLYLPQKLTDSMAIDLNDYLIIGTSLGIPALLTFLAFIWHSLPRHGEFQAEAAAWNLEAPGQAVKSPAYDAQVRSLAWLQTTCRSGAIVLLVGFWFNGGLFNLATACGFWMLLELGREAW